MGQLVDGKWQDGWFDTARSGGAFQRVDSVFRNWITANSDPGASGQGGFPAQSGRYHLYVSYACPWAHRVLMFRALKGLKDHISVDVVHPDMGEEGWTFDNTWPGATGDRLYGSDFLHQIYSRSDPAATTRVTVPILWDKEREIIVSNESAEIIRMFNSAFNAITGNHDHYWPVDLQDEIEIINDRIYQTLNNGVYRSGFATTQEAYDDAVHALFDTLDWLEDLLADHRYLLGDRLSEADFRLLPTLLRFDPVYHLHFKCNRKRVIDYPNLWAYTRELYQLPGIAATVFFDHIVRHYHYSHNSINPHRIIPINPIIDYDAPHDRGAA